jgi:hypothetical protein
VGNALSMSGEAGRYIDFGVFHISIANAIIVLLGLAIFILALVIPFPHSRDNTKSGRKP